MPMLFSDAWGVSPKTVAPRYTSAWTTAPSSLPTPSTTGVGSAAPAPSSSTLAGPLAERLDQVVQRADARRAPQRSARKQPLGGTRADRRPAEQLQINRPDSAHGRLTLVDSL